MLLLSIPRRMVPVVVLVPLLLTTLLRGKAPPEAYARQESNRGRAAGQQARGLAVEGKRAAAVAGIVILMAARTRAVAGKTRAAAVEIIKMAGTATKRLLVRVLR